MPAAVVAVHAAGARPAAGFAKPTVGRVSLQVGVGVAGDLHAGARALRQVHLVDVARYGLLHAGGADVEPGYLGENVTTTGLDLLGLGQGALLRLGPDALVRLSGMRFPRHDDPATDPVGLRLDEDGVPVGRVGVFAVVVAAGAVAAGDPVSVEEDGDGSGLRPL